MVGGVCEYFTLFLYFENFILLGRPTSFGDSELWMYLAICFLIFMLLAILLTLAIFRWWYSRSKLLGRRSAIPQVFGFLLFGMGTFLTSFLATGEAMDVVRQSDFGRGEIPPPPYFAGFLTHLVTSMLLLFAVAAIMIRIAYSLVFRPGSTLPSR